MGGRGASSGGRRGRAPHGYKTVRKVHGISVIKCSDPQGNILPRRAKANSLYLGMNNRGIVKQLRVYDKKGNVKKDIDWQHAFDGHPVGTVHIHRWKNGEREKNTRPRQDRKLGNTDR